MKFESIRYSGSKYKIIPKIQEAIDGLSITKAVDAFSGSTRVSQFFKHCGYNTVSNDMAVYSKILADCYLCAKRPHSYYQEIVDHLNSLPGKDGWYSQNYGGLATTESSVQSDGLKRPFQMHNMNKLDSIRQEIDRLYPEDCIDKSVLLTSTLLALDKVCNDMGHQASYLKDWAKKTYNIMHLEVPSYIPDDLQHEVFCGDVFDLSVDADLYYFDPPYGTSNDKTKTTRVRYFSYYHIWTTICKNDNPKLVGASKRRYDVSSDSIPGAISEFENIKEKNVQASFNKLFKKFNNNYVLVSYSNRSRVKIDDLIDIMSDYYTMKKIVKIEHAPNSQTFAVVHGKTKNEVKEDNFEYLLLGKSK